jgi:hypothetical protein
MTESSSRSTDEAESSPGKSCKEKSSGAFLVRITTENYTMRRFSLLLLCVSCTPILQTNINEFRPTREWKESLAEPKGFTASWAPQGEALLLSVNRASDLIERKMAEGTSLEGTVQRPDPDSLVGAISLSIISAALLTTSITLAATAPEEPDSDRRGNIIATGVAGLVLSPTIIDLALLPSRSKDDIEVTPNVTREQKKDIIGAKTEPAARLEVIAYAKDEELWRGTLNESGEALLPLTEPLSRRLQTGQYIELQVGNSRTYIAPPPGFRPADNILLK